MSDPIKHECGLIFLRLRKPILHYHHKYGTVFYGLHKLFLLMEKQRNRGQDGTGIASMKLHVKPGYPFLHRVRSIAPHPISDLFEQIFADIEEINKEEPEAASQPEWLQARVGFLGELLLGHLRYGTQGKNSIDFCHPFIERDRIATRNMALAGNFNLVNVKELFRQVNIHPGKLFVESDLAAILEVLRHFIVQEEEAHGTFDLATVLKRAAALFDGGYHIGGLIGNGDGFVLRDPIGIRPSYYYVDDEIVVAASERPAIQTVFDIPKDKVIELEPGHALIVKKNGTVLNEEIVAPREKRACSFERIYFSRAVDSDIYNERFSLGEILADKVLEAIDYDYDNTVFSYIPHTAEVAFHGLINGLKCRLNREKMEEIALQKINGGYPEIAGTLFRRIRMEKVVVKDVKMRTFITEDSSRDELVGYVYDVTYGILRPQEDTLVIIDDSIVRGTTLRRSILKMLDRLEPRRIIILSSAPQIRYPDCYGIDMSRMGEFVAFRAAIDLLSERGENYILEEAYHLCKELEKKGQMEKENAVHHIYSTLTDEEVSGQIAKLITPEGMKAQVDIIYQSVENLHKSCPDNLGDWYFTGNYPTPGGNRVVNRAFLNFMENRNERGY